MHRPSDASAEGEPSAPSKSPNKTDERDLSGLARTATVLPRLVVEGGKQVMVRTPRPRYVEDRRLGAGAIGEVVLAKDNDIERKVAIKRLKAEHSDMASQLRFAEEIRTVGQLEHPNIVPVHDVGIDEQGNQFFVMKYVQGETLETIIERLREKVPEYVERFTHRYRTQMFIEILRAVRHAHDEGIIHRDLKPANIMVGRFGEVMVMDWGLSKRVAAAALPFTPSPGAATPSDSIDRGFATHADSMIGTPLYMSPEQARCDNDAIDSRSDIYSLCAIFYELMTLRHYLGKRTSLAHVIHGILKEPLTMMQRSRDFAGTGAPVTLAHYVAKGLAKNPAQRFASVQDMIRRLEGIQNNRIPIECHVTFTQRIGQEVLRALDAHPWVLLIGMLTGVGFLVTKTVQLVMWTLNH